MDRANLKIADLLVRGLDRQLRKAMVKALELAVGREAPISLETFFAALLITTGQKFRKHFTNADALMMPDKKVIQKCSNESFIFVAFDPQVSQLLWDAIQIAKAMNKKSAGLDELVAAFCLKDEMVLHLEAAKGVVPKRFVKRPFPL